jgi:hypothetical protein
MRYYGDYNQSDGEAVTMPQNLSQAEVFYNQSPYKEAFDIEYPQENLEGEMYKYRCKSCKKLTTDINGRLENHGPSYEYRLLKTKPAAS